MVQVSSKTNNARSGANSFSKIFWVSLKGNLSAQKDISFAPCLTPYFDHGWAITIHKSQGTTVDQTYVLASYEMNQDDKLLTKLFTRVSNELDAMGAVSKAAFRNIADHFLGIRREQEIRTTPITQSIREEARAEKLLNQWKNTKDFSVSSSLEKESISKKTKNMKQEIEKSLPQDLRKAVQNNVHNAPPRTQDQGNNSQRARIKETLRRETEQVREENQRRFAFEERTRQIAREASRVKEKDLSL